MTCKDCVYFIDKGNHEELRTHSFWCPSWCLCGYWCTGGAVVNDWTETCCHFRRKEMDKIEIDVKINGKVAKLSDVSDETLANIKKSEVKLIEHGSYGHVKGVSKEFRLFVETGRILQAFDQDGDIRNYNVGALPQADYTITGNIFKDMAPGFNI